MSGPTAHKRKTFKSLGTPTVQAGELSSDRIDITPEEAAAAAQRRRTELEVQGEIDWVADRQPYPTGQVLLVASCVLCTITPLTTTFIGTLGTCS